MDDTPIEAAVSASVSPRCAAIRRLKLFASSAMARSRGGVVVHAGHGETVHVLPRRAGVGRRERVGIGGRHAVDHGARGIDARAREAVERRALPEREGGVELVVEVAHRRHAPADVAGQGPARRVRVHVDEAGDDPAAAHVHLLGVLRHPEAVAGGHGLDARAADDHDRVPERRAAGAVDHRRADQRDPGRPLVAAAEDGERGGEDDGRARQGQAEWGRHRSWKV